MVYIFDFDGTLVDSMPYWIEKMRAALKQFNIKAPADFIKTVTPLGDKGGAEYIRALGVPLSEQDLLKLMMEVGLPAYRDVIPAKPTVPETLRRLKEDGHRLAVLTASPHMMLDPCLLRLGLYDLFDKVWSCDDFNTTKANPDIYRRVAEELGVSVSDCVFLDDNLNALQTAKSAGMTVYAVEDAASAPYRDEIRATAARYLCRMEELYDAN